MFYIETGIKYYYLYKAKYIIRVCLGYKKALNTTSGITVFSLSSVRCTIKFFLVRGVLELIANFI